MMWQNWNKADRTLLAAAVIFLFALCLHIQYRDNTFAAGFLFCAEAALVGGIADWFAVTALFEKPLGFPWHTAILPRRRQSFIEVTGRMLQREFFGKKVLVAKMKELDCAAKLLAWLEVREHRELLAGWLADRAKKWLRDEENSNMLAAKLSAGLAGRLTEWLGSAAAAEKLRDILLYGAEELALMVRQPAFAARAERELEAYIDSRLSGPFSVMLAGFAQSMNVINTSEAAKLIQAKCLLLLEKAQQAESAEAGQIMAAAEKFLAFLQKNSDAKQELDRVLLNFVNGPGLNKCLFYTTNDADSAHLMNADAAEAVKAVDAAEAVTAVEAGLRELSGEIVGVIYRVLRENQSLQAELNGICYQLTARGALQAQELLGNIVGDVLGTMTDKQINRLVYDKAEPDLLWIRMNGSIVGAAIGLVIFAVMQLI